MKKLIPLLMVLTSGCGIVEPFMYPESGMSSLSLDQDRPLVTHSLGDPDRTRELRRSPEGHSLQVDEYRLFPKSQAFYDLVFCPFTLMFTCFTPWPSSEGLYLVGYIDGKLSQFKKVTNQEALDRAQSVGNAISGASNVLSSGILEGVSRVGKQ